MKPILFLISILFCCQTTKVHGQDYQVPKNYVLKQKDDYPKYEQDVLKTIDWLEQTSWNDQIQKREEAKTFIIKWIEGSPDISIEVNSEIIKLSKNNPELLGSYMYGYTKYAILNKSQFDLIKAKIEGIKALLSKYKFETAHKKNSEVEKLIKLDAEGKLENWVATDFAQSK